MASLPQEVVAAWEQREGPQILATVDASGKPNIVYVGCVSLFGSDKVVVADNYFSKTRANLQAGSTGAVLFITKDHKSYQVKGPLEYHTEGEIYDDMKKWNSSKHPGHAAAVLCVEEVYSGAEKLL